MMNRQRNFHSVRKRICKKTVAVLLVIGIPAILFLVTFSIKKVEVSGAQRYTDKQIKEMVLQKRQDYNSVLLYLKYKFFKTAQIPFIEKISVEMVNNHSVKVNVYEKMVTGCVEFMGEYFYFDKDGIIVESSAKKVENVPVIKGLQFDKIVLHDKLRVQKDELFDEILDLTKLIHKNKLNVNTISFGGNYEVTLGCGKIKVLLGKRDYYDDVLSDLKNILNKVKNSDLYEIDMKEYKKGMNYVIGREKKSTK